MNDWPKGEVLRVNEGSIRVRWQERSGVEERTFELDQPWGEYRYFACYWRYGSAYATGCRGLFEAQGYLEAGLDWGTLAGCCVVRNDDVPAWTPPPGIRVKI